MTWTERTIGIVIAVLITGWLLLIAAYGPHYVVPQFRRMPSGWILVLVHTALCLFFAWQLVRAYRAGSITRRNRPPIERQDRPFAFWVWVSSYVLLILMLGPVWALSRFLRPI